MRTSVDSGQVWSTLVVMMLFAAVVIDLFGVLNVYDRVHLRSKASASDWRDEEHQARAEDEKKVAALRERIRTLEAQHEAKGKDVESANQDVDASGGQLRGQYATLDASLQELHRLANAGDLRFSLGLERCEPLFQALKEGAVPTSVWEGRANVGDCLEDFEQAGARLLELSNAMSSRASEFSAALGDFATAFDAVQQTVLTSDQEVRRLVEAEVARSGAHSAQGRAQLELEHLVWKNWQRAAARRAEVGEQSGAWGFITRSGSDAVEFWVHIGGLFILIPALLLCVVRRVQLGASGQTLNCPEVCSTRGKITEPRPAGGAPEQPDEETRLLTVTPQGDNMATVTWEGPTMWLRGEFVAGLIAAKWLPENPLSAPLARIFHGWYWLYQLDPSKATGSSPQLRAQLVGNSTVGKFVSIKLGVEERLIIDPGVFVGMAVPKASKQPRKFKTWLGSLLRPAFWAWGHPLACVLYGPSEVLLYDARLRGPSATEGSDRHPIFADQLAALRVRPGDPELVTVRPLTAENHLSRILNALQLRSSVETRPGAEVWLRTYSRTGALSHRLAQRLLVHAAISVGIVALLNQVLRQLP